MMLERETFYYFLFAWMVLAIVIFPVMLRITVPYGRHTTSTWGVTMPAKMGWFIMELPVMVVFTWFFFTGNVIKTAPLLVIYALFMLHYGHRVFVFPWMMKSKGKRMPLVIVVLAFVFNVVNGFFNGYWFGWLSSGYADSWFYDSRFILGMAFFLGGMYLNMSSDYHLIGLRKGRSSGYFIPEKGLFKYISSPNLLGEIIEWMGWALMSWCWPAAAFSLWTMANLIPRAMDHHQWYKKRFPNYPKNRRALIPGGRNKK